MLRDRWISGVPARDYLRRFGAEREVRKCCYQLLMICRVPHPERSEGWEFDLRISFRALPFSRSEGGYLVVSLCSRCSRRLRMLKPSTHLLFSSVQQL